MKQRRYFADLNPAFVLGERYEKRWIIRDRVTGRPVPKAITCQYTARKSAENAAKRLNDFADAYDAQDVEPSRT